LYDSWKFFSDNRLKKLIRKEKGKERKKKNTLGTLTGVRSASASGSLSTGSILNNQTKIK